MHVCVCVCLCVRSSLEGRLAHLSQMNSITQMDTGVLDAPVGCVTVAFMHVVGAQVHTYTHTFHSFPSPLSKNTSLCCNPNHASAPTSLARARQCDCALNSASHPVAVCVCVLADSAELER